MEHRDGQQTTASTFGEYLREKRRGYNVIFQGRETQEAEVINVVVSDEEHLRYQARMIYGHQPPDDMPPHEGEDGGKWTKQ